MYEVNATKIALEDVQMGVGKVNSDGNDQNVVARTEYVIQARTSKNSGSFSNFANGVKPFVQLLPLNNVGTVYDIFTSFIEPAASVTNSHDIYTIGPTYDIQMEDFGKVQRSSIIETDDNILYKNGDKLYLEVRLHCPDGEASLDWEYSYNAFL